jgi:hypothetical protein
MASINPLGGGKPAGNPHNGNKNGNTKPNDKPSDDNQLSSFADFVQNFLNNKK